MSRIHASSRGAVALSPIGSFVSSRVAAPNGSVGNIPTFQSTFALLRTANDDEGPGFLLVLQPNFL